MIKCGYCGKLTNWGNLIAKMVVKIFPFSLTIVTKDAAVSETFAIHKKCAEEAKGEADLQLKEDMEEYTKLRLEGINSCQNN